MLTEILKKMIVWEPKFLPLKVFWKPIGFTFWVTTRCNLKCFFCLRTLKNLEVKDMEVNTFLKLSRFISKKQVWFCGLGEPLLHPNFLDFVEIAKSKKCFVAFTTNGILLTEDRAWQLIKLGVDLIIFSIDGIGEIYEKIRMGAKWEIICENLKRIVELKKKLNSKKPRLEVICIGMKSNLNFLVNLVQVLNRYVQYIKIQHPVIYDPKIQDEHLHKNVEDAEKVYSELISFSKVELRPLKPTPDYCLEPWFKPYIAMDGSVYPCCFVGDLHEIPVKEYYFGTEGFIDPEKFCLGNALLEDVFKIWNNQKIQKIRKIVRSAMAEDRKKRWEIYDFINLRKLSQYYYCKICPYRFRVAC